MSNIISNVPAWALLTVYLVLLVILAVFGDLFTFIVGTLILSLVFKNGYDREHADNH
jgi:hypothetical protein